MYEYCINKHHVIPVLPNFYSWKGTIYQIIYHLKGFEIHFFVRYRYVLHIRMWDGPYFVFLIMANIMNDSLSTSLLKYYFVTSLTIIYEVVFVMCYTTEIDRFVCSLIGIQNSWKNSVKSHITYPYTYPYNNWNFIPFAKRCWRFQIALGNTKIPPHKFWKKEWKMSSILFLIPNVSDILAFCSRKWYRWTPKFSVEYYLSEKFFGLSNFDWWNCNMMDVGFLKFCGI